MKTKLFKLLTRAILVAATLFTAFGCDKEPADNPPEQKEVVLEGEIEIVDKNGNVVERTSPGTVLRGASEGYTETEKGRIDGLGIYPVGYKVNIKVTEKDASKYTYKGMYFESTPASYVANTPPFSGYSSTRLYSNSSISFAPGNAASFIRIVAVFEASGVGFIVE